MPTITIVDNENFVCKSPYNPDFVAELKARVNHNYRQWDPADKVWRFTDLTYLKDIEDLCREYYGSDPVIRDFRYKRTGNEKDNEEWVNKEPIMPRGQCLAKLWMREDIPEPILRGYYKALSLMLHPDRDTNGALAKEIGIDMQEVNDTYDRITGRTKSHRPGR